MAKVKHVLNVSMRTTGGSAEARRLRKQGMIPAVIYSKGSENQNVSVKASEWASISRHELNLISLIDNGKEILVLLKEVQHDFIHNCASHLDFMEVKADQKIKAHVAVHAGLTLPAGAALGGILDQNLYELEVECLPANLPEFIQVDVAAMNIGDLLHVKDVQLPDGVKAVTDGDLVVFTVIDPNASAGEEAAASEEGAAAEPEVIGEKEKAEKAAAAEAEKAAKK